jgi:hypothetical protein
MGLEASIARVAAIDLELVRLNGNLIFSSGSHLISLDKLGIPLRRVCSVIAIEPVGAITCMREARLAVCPIGVYSVGLNWYRNVLPIPADCSVKLSPSRRPPPPALQGDKSRQRSL